MKRILSTAIAVVLLLSTFFTSVPASAADSMFKSVTPVIKKVSTSKYNPKITWEAVEGASAYRIYRKTSSDSSYVQICETTKLKYTDKNWEAEEGTRIAYKIRAVSGDGNVLSKYSAAKKWKVKKVHVTVTNVSSPEAIKSGKSFSLKGTISVDAGVLTKVTGKITGTDGKEYYARTEKPGKAKFSISGSQIDNALKFGSLKDGSYVYTVTVETTYSKAEEVIKAEFTVGTATPVPTATPEPTATPIPESLPYTKNGKIYMDVREDPTCLSSVLFLNEIEEVTREVMDSFWQYRDYVLPIGEITTYDPLFPEDGVFTAPLYDGGTYYLYSEQMVKKNLYYILTTLVSARDDCPCKEGMGWNLSNNTDIPHNNGERYVGFINYGKIQYVVKFYVYIVD